MKQPEKSEEEKAIESFDFYAVISAFVEKVDKFAQDKSDCYALWMLAEKSTKALTELLRRNPQSAKKWPPRQLGWPYIASPIHLAHEQMLTFFSEIGLGSKLQIPIDAERFNRTTSAWRKLLLTSIQQLEHFRHTYDIFSGTLDGQISSVERTLEEPGSKEEEKTSRVQLELLLALKSLEQGSDRLSLVFQAAVKLPPLSLGTKEQWFPVLWAYILVTTRNDPAGCRELREEAFSSAESKVEIPKGISRAPLRSGEIRGPEAFEKAIKREIRARLKQTLTSILAP